MFEYKVVAGIYSVEGADVVVENPSGKGTLQRILDHYGREGFELVNTHYDNLNREIVLLLKKGAGVAGAPAMPAMAAPPAGADDLPPPRRSAGSGGGGGRRSKADLDRLYRDS